MERQIVVVGTSQGGLHALETVLSGLREDFPLPVAVVQHRQKDSGERLCDLLQRHCRLPVGEAEDKEDILPGRVYLAPPDYHLLVEKGRFALSTEAPVDRARPSVNVLFESAAEAYGAGVVGVVLTGMGDDGARGAVHIQECGGLVVVQDPEEAESRSMPDSVIARPRSAPRVAPLGRIASLLCGLCSLEGG